MQTMPNRLVDIYLQQGTDFEQSFPITDITNFEFYGCIRKHEDSDPFVEFSLTTSATDLIVSVSAAITITMLPKTYIYEIVKKSTIDGKISLVSNGNAIVDPGVMFKSTNTGTSGGSGPTGDIIVDGGTF